MKRNEIELKSDEVQEILGKPPHHIVRYGIMVIFVVIAGLFVGSYFFKYPDIIPATITVTTENLPAGVTAKTTGRIDTLFVGEKQMVKAGDFLALIENPASLNDVLKLKNSIANYTPDTLKWEFERNLQLGDIQQSYFTFIKAYEDYQYFVNADYHLKKIKVIEKQILTQSDILRKSKTQLSLSARQLKSAKQLFNIDSTLFVNKTISSSEFENSRSVYLQQLQAFESARLSIDNQNLSILQSEQSIFDLEQQHKEQQNQLHVNLLGAYDQLQTQIKSWEQTYLLESPINGTTTLTKYWQKNQNINSGEVLVTVIPEQEAKMVGKIHLPPHGAGKVKKGQMVNVKFDNFPYMEYGMVRVKIENISLVPVTLDDKNKAYILEVSFPNKLKTNYGKELEFTQEMQGTAEIITDDLRLLDKFLNPIRDVIMR